MGKIDELIKQFCPDGVQLVSLDSVCSFKRGTTITAKKAIPGEIPVIAGGQTPSYYHNEANRDGETIAVAGSGAYAGFVSYWDTPIFLSDAFSVEPCSKVIHKYLFYYLRHNQQKIYALQKGAGVPHVHGSDISKFKIPLPPLAVQKEIVEILDTFTGMIDNLQKELEQRQKQFEHYRDQMLTFKEGEVQMKPIKEIFETRNGYTPSTKNQDFWEGGYIPWFKMDDIRDNGHILTDSHLHINPIAVKGKGLFKANSIIVATSATIGEHALVKVEHLSNQRFTNLYPKKDWVNMINMKYMYYYMYFVDQWCKEHVLQGGFASVDMGGFYKLEIPIPSLDKQQEIVDKLDTFEALISNIKQEIELRQKQYEYYREKLLTFE